MDLHELLLGQSKNTGLCCHALHSVRFQFLNPFGDCRPFAVAKFNPGQAEPIASREKSDHDVIRRLFGPPVLDLNFDSRPLAAKTDIGQLAIFEQHQPFTLPAEGETSFGRQFQGNQRRCPGDGRRQQERAHHQRTKQFFGPWHTKPSFLTNLAPELPGAIRSVLKV